MLDVSHIPGSNTFTQIFYAVGGQNDWQTWIKPRGCKFIQLFCLGGGGGGGAYTTGTSISSGGGGGAAAGITRGLIPAFLLPDILYIQVGSGGNGATSAGATVTTGTSGSISYISLTPTTSSQTVILASSNTVAGTAITNAPGTAPSIFTSTNGAFSSLSIFIGIAGIGGVAGNSQSSGSNTTALVTSLVTPGASGGGKNSSVPTQYVGGNIVSASILSNTVNGGVAGGGVGESGYYLSEPFCAVGGAGGGGRASGVGGNGGNGAYGCGGGGAGAGSAGGGSGGKGGDGLVIITSIF